VEHGVTGERGEKGLRGDAMTPSPPVAAWWRPVSVADHTPLANHSSTQSQPFYSNAVTSNGCEGPKAKRKVAPTKGRTVALVRLRLGGRARHPGRDDGCA